MLILTNTPVLCPWAGHLRASASIFSITSSACSPLGLSSEAAIGGVGGAKGYLNNAEQTKASLCPFHLHPPSRPGVDRLLRGV